MKKLIPATLQKTGELLFKDKQSYICLSKDCAAVISARYYKGISAAGDNVVIVAVEDE